MSANITLKQADFSANNIGRVVVISELTKKVLAKQTQYSQDSAEAVALDTFLGHLTEGGYIGGESPLLKVLMLPALASSHAELFYNIALLDDGGYPTNWMPANEISAETKKYSVITEGGYNIGAATNVQIQFNEGFGFSVNGAFSAIVNKMPPLSIITYLCKEMSATSLATRQLVGWGIITSPIITFSPVQAQVGGTGWKTGTAYIHAETTQATAPKGFYGMSYDKDNYNLHINFHGVTAYTKTEAGAADSMTGPSASYTDNYLFFSSGSADSVRSKSAMVACGGGLTASQLAELKGWSDTLMTALHVI